MSSNSLDYLPLTLRDWARHTLEMADCRFELSSDHTYQKSKIKRDFPNIFHCRTVHLRIWVTPWKPYPVKQTKRKRQQLTPSGKTPISKRNAVPSQTGCVSLATTRSHWSAREKEVLVDWVQTNQKGKESDSEYWLTCSHHINGIFPESKRTGDSCRKAYNRQILTPTTASAETSDSLGIEFDESMISFTSTVAVQTDLSFMDLTRAAEHTEGDWIFMEPLSEMKKGASKAAQTIHSVAARRMRQYADLKQGERARLIDSLCNGSSHQLAREMLSSALGNDLRCLMLNDIELEAKEYASRIVLHPKQFKDLR